jgi:hypothetical protein
VNRTAVSSGAIGSVGYDRDRMVLEVELTNGRVYHYFDVPEQVFLEFMGADSLGKYYNINIKPSYRFAPL